MNYQVEVLPKAAEAVRRLDTPIRYRILIRLKWLSINLDSIQHQALTGNLRAIYKFRVGDYRILYSINHAKKLLFVHRRDVYED